MPSFKWPRSSNLSRVFSRCVVICVVLFFSTLSWADALRLRPQKLASPDIPGCELVTSLQGIRARFPALQTELDRVWAHAAEADRAVPSTELYKLLSLIKSGSPAIANRLAANADRSRLLSLLESLPARNPLRADHVDLILAYKASLVRIEEAALIEVKSALNSAQSYAKSLPSALSLAEQSQLRQLCLDWQRQAGPTGGGALPSLGGSAGLSWEGALISGLADFVVDRANQELVLWLVSVFQETLCQESASLFRQTCMLLHTTRKAPASHGGLLASAIRADLESLPLGVFGSVYKEARDVQWLFQTLRAGSPQEVLLQLRALLQRQRTLLDPQCKASHYSSSSCQVMLVTRVLLFAVEVLQKSKTQNQTACAVIQTTLADSGSAAAQLLLDPSIRSALSPSLQQLLQAPATAVCPTDETQPGPAVTPLHALSAITGSLRALFAGPKTLDSVLLSGAALLRQSLDLALPPSLASPVGFELRRAVAALASAEGLYSLLAGLRKGAAAPELLASLGTTLERTLHALQSDASGDTTSLCASSPGADRAVPAFCALAATGTLLAHFGGVVAALTTPRAGGALSWNEAEVCRALQQLAMSPIDAAQIQRLFGGPAHVPSPLREFFQPAAPWQCSAIPVSDEGYRQVRALAQSLFDLDQRLRQWRSGTAPPSVQIAAETLGLVATLVESGAELLSASDGPQLEALLSMMHATQAMLRGAYADGIRQLLVALASTQQATELLPPSLTRYLPLISDLASAKDPKDVQAALGAAAAPVGSWRSKRQGFSLTLTGVVGAQVGGEVVAPGSSQPGLVGGAALGPLAALGFDLQTPMHHAPTWSWGIYATVIDLGQLAWARVSHTGPSEGSQANAQLRVNTASEVSVLSVLSPGLYLKFGAGTTPLTFGIGASYAPQLRTYFYVDNQPQERSDPFSMIRFGAFAAVDLNLFPLVVR